MDLPDLDPTYGALLIGVLFATFFQGVLSVQTYVYYENFYTDPWKMKALVAAVWCIDMLHLVLISQNSYYYVVTKWGNQSALEFSIWQGNLHPAISGLAALTCQLFYLRRIWVFSSKNKILVLLLTSLCLTTFALDVTISANTMKNPSVTVFVSLTKEAIALFAIGAGTDVFMALLLCLYIRRARSGYKKTNYVISRIVRYTMTTSLATSMLAIGCLVAYFASPNSLVFIAMHFSLGRAYTNSLLANLNSRRNLKSDKISKQDEVAQNVTEETTSPSFHFRPMVMGTSTSRSGDTSYQTDSCPVCGTRGDVQHIRLDTLEEGRATDSATNVDQFKGAKN